MTMCFSRDAGQKDPDIMNVFACADVFETGDVFRGVSLAGVRGTDAMRPGESRSRVTLAVRGKVNIMCNADTLAAIPVGSAVGYDSTRLVFDGFGGTPVRALVRCSAGDDRCIGTLVSKGDRRHRTNCAAVLLK
jgi:hypothetical protein